MKHGALAALMFIAAGAFAKSTSSTLQNSPPTLPDSLATDVSIKKVMEPRLQKEFKDRAQAMAREDSLRARLQDQLAACDARRQAQSGAAEQLDVLAQQLGIDLQTTETKSADGKTTGSR
jgi:Skp family chaperone for outer membrane proteins